MGKFVTKQIEVDAYEFTGSPSSAAEIAEALGAQDFKWDSKPLDGDGARSAFYVDFGGSFVMNEGDWVVSQPSDDGPLLLVYSRDGFIAKFDEKKSVRTDQWTVPPYRCAALAWQGIGESVGACVLSAGHEGAHRSADGRSWERS